MQPASNRRPRLARHRFPSDYPSRRRTVEQIFHVSKTSPILPSPAHYPSGTPRQGPDAGWWALRSLKTGELHIRPTRHRVQNRVPAHLSLCLVPYYVQRHLRQGLAPLRFDDEDLEAKQARRDPILAAQTSETAKRKKWTRRTEDRLPLQSLETLMAHLETRVRYQCRLPSEPDGLRVQRLTEPNPLQ